MDYEKAAAAAAELSKLSDPHRQRAVDKLTVEALVDIAASLRALVAPTRVMVGESVSEEQARAAIDRGTLWIQPDIGPHYDGPRVDRPVSAPTPEPDDLDDDFAEAENAKAKTDGFEKLRAKKAKK